MSITDESDVVRLLDKLGERLAFERGGARLYDLLLHKLQQAGGFDGGPRENELREIRSEEEHHVLFVSDVITELGGDPSATTPSADLVSVLCEGIRTVVADVTRTGSRM